MDSLILLLQTLSSNAQNEFRISLNDDSQLAETKTLICIVHLDLHRTSNMQILARDINNQRTNVIVFVIQNKELCHEKFICISA